MLDAARHPLQVPLGMASGLALSFSRQEPAVAAETSNLAEGVRKNV
jgi:hypothetical protein